MRSYAFARPMLAAALITAALIAQLLLLSASDGAGATTMSAAEESGNARAASVSMARKFPSRGRTMFRAAVIATQHWGGLPCGGRVAIKWTPMPMNTNAVASWKAPGGTRNPARYFGCKIKFNSRIHFDWKRLCTTMGHEVGHLLGKRHTGRTGQFMSKVYRAPARKCR